VCINPLVRCGDVFIGMGSGREYLFPSVARGRDREISTFERRRRFKGNSLSYSTVSKCEQEIGFALPRE
jgi:hypothetical protein